ncbi:MAG TPA: PaaI family thioesterase [Actinomycetes bacterium]|nr:PaaI family thioesterase [Actinomycetes bacterium]
MSKPPGGAGRTVDVPPGAQAPERHPAAPAPGEPVPSHYARCFACGDDTAGLAMSVVAGEGVNVVARFTVTGRHQGAPGLAHGGLLAAAFDEALGSLQWLLQVPSVTARLQTDFLRPVPVGSTVHIDARVLGRLGRRIWSCAEGRLGSAGGPVVVTAAALFVVVPLEHFSEHGRPAEVLAARDDDRVRHTVRSFEVNP